MSPSDFKKYIEDHFITPNGFFYINRARKHPEAINSMREHTGINDDMTAIYCAYHNIPCKKCLGCGGNLRVKCFKMGFTHDSCSIKCGRNNEQYHRRYKEGSLRRYGVENPMKSSEVRGKYLETIMRNHGVTNASYIEESVKKARAKVALNWDESVEKMKETKRDQFFEKIGKETTEILLSAEKLERVYLTYGRMGGSKHLGISPMAFSRWCDTHGINRKRRISSQEEQKVERLLISLDIHYIRNKKSILTNGHYELDFYLPDHDVAIEVNGIYWHTTKPISTVKKKQESHRLKFEQARERGIRLLQFWDFDINLEWEWVSGEIKQVIGIIPPQINDPVCNNMLSESWKYEMMGLRPIYDLKPHVIWYHTKERRIVQPNDEDDVMYGNGCRRTLDAGYTVYGVAR